MSTVVHAACLEVWHFCSLQPKTLGRRRDSSQADDRA